VRSKADEMAHLI